MAHAHPRADALVHFNMTTGFLKSAYRDPPPRRISVRYNQASSSPRANNVNNDFLMVAAALCSCGSTSACTPAPSHWDALPSCRSCVPPDGPLLLCTLHPTSPTSTCSRSSSAWGRCR